MFVAAAFVLGLITKCYRDAHPSPATSQPGIGTASIQQAKERLRDSAGATAGKPRASSITTGRKGTRKSARTEKLKSPNPALEPEQE